MTIPSRLASQLSRLSIPSRYRDAGLFVLLAALFGGSFVAIKTGLRELPPVLFAGLRFDVAAVVLLAYIVGTRPRAAWLPRTRSDLLGIGAAGVFLVALNNGLLFLGQGSTSAAMASIMYGLNPVLAPVFAWWLLGDRLSRLGLLGIGVALAGVVIIVQPSPATISDGSVLGQVLVLGAAVAVALGSVLLERSQPRLESLPVTAWAMVVGALLLHGLSLGAGESATSISTIGPVTIASLLILAIPSTAIAYAILFGLLNRLGSVRTNLVAYVVPMFAALTGWLLFGASISAWTVIGFCVIVVGFGLVERQTLQTELRQVTQRLEDPEPTPTASPPCDD